GDAFTLEPWLRWWISERQGNWFALFSRPGSQALVNSDDLLMVGALRPSSWKESAWQGRSAQVRPLVLANIDQDAIVLDMPLGGGGRSWMLAALPAEGSMENPAQNHESAPLVPQQYLVKYGDFPL